MYRREGGYLERDGVQVNIGKTIMTFNCYFFEKDIYVYDIGYLLTWYRNVFSEYFELQNVVLSYKIE